MYEFFRDLDRRWIFLLMFLAVSTSILLGVRFPEKPSSMVNNVFKSIDELPEGSAVLMAFDYDPASKGELQPMAYAFTRHAATKGHRLYFLTLWPQGVPMVQQNITILEREYGDRYEYGRNYVNLGFKPGAEGVIKVLVGDLKELYPTDVHGTSLTRIPMTRDLKNIQQMDLIVNVSAGTPGAKEWVQYAATPFDISMVAGTTGVQAPILYPYIPNQLNGVLGAIKAAAEYEQAIIENYPDFKDNAQAQEGLRRMGPQLVAHLLLIVLIIGGNVIYFVGRSRGAAQ